MSTIQTVADTHNPVFSDNKDVVDTWFLMGSPTLIVSIVVTYLYFVLKLGPQMMATRKPYNLQGLLVAYNFILVLFSLFLAPFAQGMFDHIITEGCRPSTRVKHELSRKVIELADTVFFVLRKKQKQITFLHVYHHSSLAFFSWCYLKTCRGQGVVIGFLNSFVHVIMYFYYMVSALGPQYQKYIWWKKYMTGLQLTQFVIMLAYLVSVTVRDCNLPRHLSILMGVNVFLFLCLFTNFYVKTYKESKKNK
ncbi:hypothetical protein L9F63_016689 [Diploptera punctata]|uniref:Elongation of very long chain fatty acids protein n=1 Tax=Diploptera punctata TaxID=6984 RepID=A0AAD8EGZ0_DIPPU|nr:hypothetical protein L9F63_016689 [Diploptera punctata]